MTLATLYRFLRTHVDELIKMNTCIRVPLDVLRVICMVACGCECREDAAIKKKANFQRDPADARVNKGGEGTQGGVCSSCTSASTRLLLSLNAGMRLKQRGIVGVCAE